MFISVCFPENRPSCMIFPSGKFNRLWYPTNLPCSIAVSRVIAGVADLYIGLGCGYMEVLFLFSVRDKPIILISMDFWFPMISTYVKDGGSAGKSISIWIVLSLSNWKIRLKSTPSISRTFPENRFILSWTTQSSCMVRDVCGSCFSVMYIRLTVSRNRMLSTVTTDVFRATQFGLVIIFSAWSEDMSRGRKSDKKALISDSLYVL